MSEGLQIALSVGGGLASSIIGGLVVAWQAGRVYGRTLTRMDTVEVHVAKHDDRLDRHDSRISANESAVARHDGILAGRVS